MNKRVLLEICKRSDFTPGGAREKHFWQVVLTNTPQGHFAVSKEYRKKKDAENYARNLWPFIGAAYLMIGNEWWRIGE